MPWTPAEDALLAERYPNEPTADIARDLHRDVTTVYRRASRLGLFKTEAYMSSPASCRLRRGDEVGRDHRFKKGQTPHNKGKRRPGWAPGRMAETQFKKGHRGGKAAQLYQPIGTERPYKGGYTQRKVNDDFPLQRRWKFVHVIAWEEAHGPVPPGHCVAFKNRDKTDVRLDNLELISRAENMRRNSYHRYGKDIARVIQLRGAVQRQINKRDRREKQAHRPA
jgi:hypothetical protein